MTTSQLRSVIATWLTQAPHPGSFRVAALSSLVVIATTLCAWNIPGVEDALIASPETVFSHGEYYRLWTTCLLHGDLGHLASNMLLFPFLGYFLYGYFGSAVFPIAAFLMGGLANILELSRAQTDLHLLGASGVVYAMGGTWLVFYFFLSRQKNTWQRWLRSTGIALALFAPKETFQPQVSHQTHLAGFALGALFALSYYLLWRKKFRSAEILGPPPVDESIYDELPHAEGRFTSSQELFGTTVDIAVIPNGSRLSRVERHGQKLDLFINPALILVRNTQAEGDEAWLEQALSITFQSLDEQSDVDPEPGLIRSAELILESADLVREWPLPFEYNGFCEVRLRTGSHETRIRSRGIRISATGPARPLTTPDHSM